MSKRKLTWEYSMYRYQIGEKKKGVENAKALPLQDVEDVLNRLGSLGWEIVSVIPDSTFLSGAIGFADLLYILVLMKRPRLVE